MRHRAARYFGWSDYWLKMKKVAVQTRGPGVPMTLCALCKMAWVFTPHAENRMGRRGNFILAGSRETIIFPLCVKGSLLKRSEATTELFSLTITPGLLLSEFSHPNRNTPKEKCE